MYVCILLFYLFWKIYEKENPESVVYRHTWSPIVSLWLDSGVILCPPLSSKAGVELFPGKSCLGFKYFVNCFSRFFLFLLFLSLFLPSLLVSFLFFFFFFPSWEHTKIWREKNWKCKNALQSQPILFKIVSQPSPPHLDNYGQKKDLVSKCSCSFEVGQACLIFSMRKWWWMEEKIMMSLKLD